MVMGESLQDKSLGVKDLIISDLSDNELHWGLAILYYEM